jgi:hypothetical protein
MKPTNVVSAVHFLERSDGLGSLPVLTDVLLPARSRSGRMLWLAWDDRRLPLLADVVDDDEAAVLALDAQLRDRRSTR